MDTASPKARLAAVAAQPPRASVPEEGHLPALDGWHAVAIAAVILYHGLPAHGPARFGASGVSIFFALSGFLICSRLLAERERSGRIDLGGFYVRRAFRIMPPYLLYLAVL